jgi:hypothetical protein
MVTKYKCRYTFIATTGQMFFLGDEIDSFEYDRLEIYEQINFKNVEL